MRAKVLVSVFVALAMLVSFGMAAKASADMIMFPWVVKSTTVATMLSVVQTSVTDNTACPNPQLHYQYYFKAEKTPPVATDICDVQSFTVSTSQNDLVTFDASGAISGGAALFNDQPPIHGRVTYSPNNFSMTSAVNPSRAFLLVDNNNTDCFDDYDYASLYGEALVLQLNQGAAWGYIAMNARYGGPHYPDAVPFNDETDMQGEVLRSPRYFDNADTDSELETAPTVLLPLSTFKTKMFVTPVNYAQYENDVNGDTTYSSSAPGVMNTSSNSRIQFCLNPIAGSTFPITTPCPSPLGGITYNGEDCQSDTRAVCAHGGIYDNDEGPMDSRLTPNVVCTAALDISTPGLLLTQAQIDYLTSQPGGAAWTYVRSMVGSFFTPGQLGQRNVNTESDSIVGKLEYSDSTSGITIGGTTIGGAVNDFKWLRNSASLEDWSLDHGINFIGSETWTE